MKKFVMVLAAVGKVLWLAIRPIPGWHDILQRLLIVLLIAAPALVGTWTNRLSNVNGLLASAGLLIVALVVAASRLKMERDAILDDMPNLVCKGTSRKENVPIHDGQGHVFGAPTFYHLRIANEPKGKASRQSARKVAGTVRILFSDGNEACAGKLHKWEHTFGPAELGKFADLHQAIDIPPSGIEVNLDIGMKYDEDDCFYTPTNETATIHKDFRDARYKFCPGVYFASVRLAGENVETSLRCRIVNKGKNEKLEVAFTSYD